MNNRINVTRSSMPPIEDYIETIKPLWDSSWLTNMGVLHTQFEERLKKYLQTPNISLLTNGHLGLELLIQAMHLSGEIITTPFTFASTTHAIVRNGIKPVFCDIDPYSYTIDTNKIESLITDKTTAILPVHIYGNICDVAKIEEIAQKYKLKIIYDAAHSFGTTLNGIGVGNFGDASVFSFHATKVFNSIEGGAVTYSDLKIGEELYKLKNFGIKSQFDIDGVGSNAKMNEFQAAMGICNLKYINKEIAKRKAIYERYVKHLSHIKGIQLMKINKDIVTNYSYFPVLFNENILNRDRETICSKLEKENIFPRRYFYPLTSDFECYRGMFDTSKTPVAKYVSDRILTLPMYSDLKLNDVDRICDIILSD